MDKKYVCSQCFKNQGLKDVIKASKKDQGSCCFCSSAGKRLPIKAVISHIKKCIQREYEIRNPGTYNIKEVLERVGFQAHKGVHTYIAKQLQGPSYCSRTETDCTSSPLEIQPLQEHWANFEKLIKEKYRFSMSEHEINYNALGGRYKPYDFLKIFCASMRAADFPFEMIEKGEPIFRVRPDDFRGPYTATNMGPPSAPSPIPTRLSPLGISAFYGASSKQTCIDEIKTTATKFQVGIWHLNEPVRVIDFRRRKSDVEPDFFHASEQHTSKRKLIRFLKSFPDEVSKPIDKRDRSEDLDYVPTQAVAEHIKLTFSDVRGVIYDSSKSKAGYNICLFTEKIKFVDAHDKNSPAGSVSCQLIECYTERVSG